MVFMTIMNRENCLLLFRSALTATVVAALLPLSGYAQLWKPEKAVEIIIGTTPGGPQDRTGRLVQRLIQERKLVEPPSTVVNKPGGGGAVGMSYLAQHAPDPHYMMVVAQPLISNHVSGRSKLTYTDFTPLAVLGVEYVCIVVRPDSPLTNARDLVARLRKDPASVSIAVGTALGNATHSSVAHALKTAGVEIKKMRAVVFNSGGESMAAVMGGHIDAAAGSISTVLAQVRAGRVRAIVVGAPKRWVGEFAAVPTWKEIGIDSALDLWRGLAAPKGLSTAQVAYWDATFARMVKDEDWRKDLDSNLMDNVYKNSADTYKHWQAEYAEVKALFVDMGLTK